MGTSARRTAPLLLVLALVLGSLGLSALGSPSVAASAKGTVTGEVRPGGFPVKMRWFDADWNYLGARKFTNGIYSLSLAPGTY